MPLSYNPHAPAGSDRSRSPAEFVAESDSTPPSLPMFPPPRNKMATRGRLRTASSALAAEMMNKTAGTCGWTAPFSAATAAADMQKIERASKRGWPPARLLMPCPPPLDDDEDDVGSGGYAPQHQKLKRRRGSAGGGGGGGGGRGGGSKKNRKGRSSGRAQRGSDGQAGALGRHQLHGSRTRDKQS